MQGGQKEIEDVLRAFSLGGVRMREGKGEKRAWNPGNSLTSVQGVIVPSLPFLPPSWTRAKGWRAPEASAQGKVISRHLKYLKLLVTVIIYSFPRWFILPRALEKILKKTMVTPPWRLPPKNVPSVRRRNCSVNASHPAPQVSLFLSNGLMNRAHMAAWRTCMAWKITMVMRVSSQRPIWSQPLQVPDIPAALTYPGLSYEATLKGTRPYGVANAQQCFCHGVGVRGWKWTESTHSSCA